MNLNTFEEYTEALILAFEKKRDQGLLPPNLERHTPASLKRECIQEFPSRYSDKDSRTFRMLFGSVENSDDYLKKIKTSEASFYKPLNNFLKGETESTQEKNIHLLAWLIDFEARPFKPGMMYDPEFEPMETSEGVTAPSESEEEGQVITVATDNDVETDVIDKDDKEKRPTGQLVHESKSGKFILGIPVKFKRTVIAFCATLAILASIYLAYILKPHECMYWDGDQYQAIACDQKVEGASTIALDPARLDEVKRITNISAITRKDIGKIYYSKESGKVEFYTGSGENPADTRKRLLPMTEHIFEKYVLGLAVSP